MNWQTALILAVAIPTLFYLFNKNYRLFLPPPDEKIKRYRRIHTLR